MLNPDPTQILGNSPKTTIYSGPPTRTRRNHRLSQIA